MKDIGQYHIVQDGEDYIVTEQLSGKERRCYSVKQVLEWIEEDMTAAEITDGED